MIGTSLHLIYSFFVLVWIWIRLGLFHFRLPNPALLKNQSKNTNLQKNLIVFFIVNKL